MRKPTIALSHLSYTFEAVKRELPRFVAEYESFAEKAEAWNAFATEACAAYDAWAKKYQMQTRVAESYGRTRNKVREVPTYGPGEVAKYFSTIDHKAMDPRARVAKQEADDAKRRKDEESARAKEREKADQEHKRARLFAEASAHFQTPILGEDELTDAVVAALPLLGLTLAGIRYRMDPYGDPDGVENAAYTARKAGAITEETFKLIEQIAESCREERDSRAFREVADFKDKAMAKATELGIAKFAEFVLEAVYE